MYCVFIIGLCIGLFVCIGKPTSRAVCVDRYRPIRVHR